jgi:hypothetical protein
MTYMEVGNPEVILGPIPYRTVELPENGVMGNFD